MRLTTRRFFALLVLASVSLLGWGLTGLAPVTEAQGPKTFSNKHFDGAYGFVFSGFIGDQYTVATATLIADGNGGAYGTVYLNPPGTPLGAPDGTAMSYSSPYTVRPDGTGFAEVSFAPDPATVFNVAFVLTDVRGGVAHTVLFNQNTAPFFLSGQAIRQASRDDD